MQIKNCKKLKLKQYFEKQEHKGRRNMLEKN